MNIGWWLSIKNKKARLFSQSGFYVVAEVRPSAETCVRQRADMRPVLGSYYGSYPQPSASRFKLFFSFQSLAFSVEAFGMNNFPGAIPDSIALFTQFIMTQ